MLTQSIANQPSIHRVGDSIGLSSYGPTGISQPYPLTHVHVTPSVNVTIVTQRELCNPHYEVVRLLFFRLASRDGGFTAEWDAIEEQVAGADQDTAIANLCARIIELYEEWTDPLRANTPEEDDKLAAMMQYVKQVSDPDDEGWLRVAAATHLPRE